MLGKGKGRAEEDDVSAVDDDAALEQLGYKVSSIHSGVKSIFTEGLMDAMINFVADFPKRVVRMIFLPLLVHHDDTLLILCIF